MKDGNGSISLVILLCIVIAILLVGGAEINRAEAQPIDIVKVSGSAPLGQVQRAIEDAKKRAVFKVFSHTTRAEKDSSSIFAQMMEQYNDYVRECKVVSQHNSGNQLLVISAVTVNHAKLEADFQDKVEKKQLINDAMTASILMRAVNTTDNWGNGERLQQAFYHRFGNSGFQTELEDDDIKLVRSSLSTADYGSYLNAVRGLVQNNTIMANFVMVGETSIDQLEPNAGGLGYTAKSSVRIQAYDCINKTLLGSFEENYEILAATASEAEKMAIEKAGLDAAEAMVNKTLKYWRQHS